MDQFLDKYIFPHTRGWFGWSKKTTDGLPVYTAREERLNMISHIIGILIGFGMLNVSFFSHHSELGLVGGVIFSLSLIVLYTASSVYHGTGMKDTRLKKLLRLLDHCSIFVLIAGTCTPLMLCMIERRPADTEWFFYAVVWALALGGITLLCVDMKRFKSISVVMYVMMGALMMLRAELLSTLIGDTATRLIVGGGLSYLIGLLFYGLGSQNEWMHAVFHVFCLMGSVLHCVCIAGYVI